jgi:polar amino acid transport system substrate-binding protein
MIGRRPLLALIVPFVFAGRFALAEIPLLRVGTNAAGAPWSFHDPGTNRELGIAVELIQEIAADAGFKIEFVPLTLPDLIPALNARRVDIIAGNLLITPQRAAQVDFSDAIAAGGDGLVVRKTGTGTYVTLDDLRGLKLATQTGPFADTIRKSALFPDLKVYPTGSDAMQAVSAGECDAAIVGVNGAAYEMKLGHFPNLQLVRSYQPMVSSVDAFSVRKGDDALLRQINTSLAKMHANGTVKRILAEYGQ